MPQVGTNPIYQSVLTSTKGSITANNIIYWRNIAASPTADGSEHLNNAFISQVVPDWLDLISSFVTLEKISTRRLNNLTDFNEQSIQSTGSQNGDFTNNFTTFKIAKIRTTKETKSGWINIMGVREDDTDAGGNTLVAATQTRLATLAGSLNANLVNGGDDFIAVIVGNLRDYSVVPSVLNPEDEWVYQDVSSHDDLVNVSSEVGRKFRPS